jgi:hypothetical protein
LSAVLGAPIRGAELLLGEVAANEGFLILGGGLMTRSCGLNFFIWSCLAASSALWLARVSIAATTIGNWEDGQADGWIDWSGGQLPISSPSYGFNSTGATLGSKAVQFSEPFNSTYTQWLAFCKPTVQAGAQAAMRIAAVRE